VPPGVEVVVPALNEPPLALPTEKPVATQKAAPTSRSIGPYVLGGVGLATLGVGLFLFATGNSDYHQAVKTHCLTQPGACTETEAASSDLRDPLARARTGTIVAVLGGTVFVGAGVWFALDGPGPATTRLWIAPTLGGARFGAAF